MEIKENMRKTFTSRACGRWKRRITWCFYSEEKEGYMMNAGYVLEPVLLYMTGKGLGTCYLGSTRIPGAEPAVMKAAIAVAFGYPKSLLYRDPATAKRLPLKRTLRV